MRPAVLRITHAARAALALLLALAPLFGAAQAPLYIVNGQRIDYRRAAAIPAGNIERMEELPADEETIAQYGPEASNGVCLITLRYDVAARFPADSVSFDHYVAGRVVWDADEPAARVVLRYRITAEGMLVVTSELQATDKRLRRRVLQVVREAPRWEPARKAGVPVESEGVLRIQLPEGKHMPREVELIWR